MDEFARIATLLRPLATSPEALNLEDDAAWLQPPAGHTLIATKDALVAGVHFIGDEDPADVARKALRVNLSDLAAMGSDPYGYLLATQLPADLPTEWLARFAEGLRADQAEFSLRLFGGDSVSTSGPIALSVTMLGLLPPGISPLRRSGAKVGDVLCVSGTLGLGALGLCAIREGLAAPYMRTRYLCPEPRLALGRALRGVASAAMDISDGLVQDAGHLARASGVGIAIDAALLPLSTSGDFSDEACLRAALCGGDDYELLFTLPPDAALPQGVTKIGRVIHGVEVSLLHSPWEVAELQGWNHYET